MKQYVIIGSSAAGIAAAEAIRKKDKASRIVMLSDEDYPVYCRCLISYYLAGEIKEEGISYRTQDFFKENNIELLLNKKVTRVDPKKNKITCLDKTQFDYDALLIATGAHPKFPEITGIKKKAVFGFRTIKDAKEIDGLLPVAKTACVLGGGLIGLKAACALKKRNIDVKVIIKSKQVLSQMLNAQAAQFVQERLNQHGIELILGQDVTEVIGDGTGLKAVKLESGKAIGCSLVIVGKGVEPNVDLIKDSGIKVNEGIVSNNLLQTTVENIYVAGDACESFDVALGKTTVNALWPIAVEQGKIAGANMAQAGIRYAGSLGINSIDFFGLPVISLGVYRLPAEEAKETEELNITNAKENIYKRLLIRNNILTGAILIGDIKNSGVFLRAIREKIDIRPFKDKLLSPNFGYPDIMEFVKDKEKIYV